MARDTQANPRLGPKPAALAYHGTKIDVDRLDATSRYETATYIAHRYYSTYPRPKLAALGKGFGSPSAMVTSATAEGYKAFINAGNGGSMDLLQKAQFEATHPGVVEAYEDWAAWAWAVNEQAR